MKQKTGSAMLPVFFLRLALNGAGLFDRPSAFRELLDDPHGVDRPDIKHSPEARWERLHGRAGEHDRRVETGESLHRGEMGLGVITIDHIEDQSHFASVFFDAGAHHLDHPEVLRIFRRLRFKARETGFEISFSRKPLEDLPVARISERLVFERLQ